MSVAHYERHRMLFLSLSTVLVLIVSWISSVHGAHSRHRARYVVQKENEFDRATASFTNEGRLLQMEYGMEAAERGFTGAVINVEENKEAGEGNEDESSDNAILAFVPRGGGVYALDDHVYMVSTGVMGDVFFMTQHLRSFCQDFRRAYGEAPTIREVAQRSALVQHSLTMRDSHRPLGTAVSILGVDPHSTKQRVFRTDPGGMLEECRFCVVGKNQARIMRDLTKDLPRILRKGKRNKRLEVLKAAINSFNLGSEETVDVWILRVGESQCFLNVDNENCNKIQVDA